MLEIENYVTSAWHDAVRIKEAKVNKWVSDIEPLLNMEETRKQGALVNKSGRLEDAYNSIIGEDVNGSGILMDAMQMKRILIFKDAQSMVKYNQMYGHKNVSKAVFENMDMMDNHLTIGETLGYGYTRTLPINGKKVTTFRLLKGESYKREVQRYESGRKLDAERANQRFQSIHENAVKIPAIAI